MATTVPTLSQAAGQLNIEIEQGSRFNPILTYEDSAGTPIDLTTHTAVLQIRKEKKSNALWGELTTENGGIVLGNGTIELLITGAESDAYTFDEAVYQLVITDQNGHPTRILEGAFTVDPTIISTV